ncbi:MAG: hypothetical protein ISR72_06315 [Methylobacter sp.]|nr:hypothetical protein [Methylobacter sp.]
MLKRLLTYPSRACRVGLLIVALFSLMIDQPAFAHAGVDHNNSCFLTVGDTRLRISAYQFQPELEGKAHAPKHFCHFFPELGQIVVALEPMAETQETPWVTLELAALTSWQNPDQAFTVIKQQPVQFMDGGLASISQNIQQRGIYRLNVTLQNASGHSQQQHFVFLVGIPVTKILVMIAGMLVLVIGFAGVKDFIKKNRRQ